MQENANNCVILILKPSHPYGLLSFKISQALFLTFSYQTLSFRARTKQLQSKLNLLNNRFTNKIDIKQHFKVPPEISFEKIIEKLYTYRSDIAHGNNVDFEDKLKELNNHDKVQSFLTALVKECIKQSLIEPQLINNLRMLNLQVAKVQK